MKTPSRLLCFTPAALLAALSLLVGGCANRPQSSGGEIVVVETQNIWVTGSHIPVRVPKSTTARMIPTISPLTILTADDMRRASGPAAPPMH